MKVPSGPTHDVAAKLICQCGCKLVLADCPHEECPARPGLVARIQAHLASGKDVQAATQAMAAEYGEKILAAPNFRDHPTPWVQPTLTLAAGAVLVAVLIRRWGGRPAPSPTASGKAPSPEMLARLERELKEDL